MRFFNKAAWTTVVLGILSTTACTMTENEAISSEGYIAKSEIVLEEGRMTPEALLAFGRLSDPQVSPDGKHILYGVSYTSIPENRSVRNLFICNLDGSDNQQLTTSGNSISNARWSADGKHIAFLMGGQIWTAGINADGGSWKLEDVHKVSDVPAGIAMAEP